MFCVFKNWDPQPSFLYLHHDFSVPHVWKLSHWNMYDTVTHKWEECTENVLCTVFFLLAFLLNWSIKRYKIPGKMHIFIHMHLSVSLLMTVYGFFIGAMIWFWRGSSVHIFCSYKKHRAENQPLSDWNEDRLVMQL